MEQTYSIEEIQERLKEMSNEQCLHVLTQYAGKEQLTDNFNDKMYYNNVVELIKNELLSRMK